MRTTSLASYSQTYGMNSKVVPVCTCKCSCSLRHAGCSSDPPPHLPDSSACDRDHPYKQQQEDVQQGSQQHGEAQPLALLQLKVRALEKYKSNYELLCSQLGELNAQVGLQLEQHEADVSSLNATVVSLQQRNGELERALQESQAQLETQRQVVSQDRAYSERVHAQLSTAAELLQATEKRIESREQELSSQAAALQTQLDASEKESRTLTLQNGELRDELLECKQAATEELQKAAQKAAKLKQKLRNQITALQNEAEALTGELETQRALTRTTKKQLAHQISENEALAKQLGSVKGDVESLSLMLNQQQEAATHQQHKHAKCKKQVQQAEALAARATRQVDSLQSELVAVQEDLVCKNTTIEALQSELRALRAQLEQQSRDCEHSSATIEVLRRQVASLEQLKDVERSKREERERAKVRANRNELQQMRQLLAVNHQKAAESSRDVRKLKSELFGVQEMLHAYHSERDSWRQFISDDRSPKEQSIAAGVKGKAEESVLKCAIMEQVVRAYENPAPEAPTHAKARRSKKTNK